MPLPTSVSTIPPAPLPELEQVKRYWDAQHGLIAARLLPGEYYVTTGSELVTTVLGSCISACVRDARLGIGGMNHFMLPGEGSDAGTWTDAASAATRYGAAAMEYLINAILTLGGRRERLEFKLVGGGNVIEGMDSTRIGERNIEFVRSYLRLEGFQAVAEDLGGSHPRKVLYFPQTGQLKVKAMRPEAAETLRVRESAYRRDLHARGSVGTVELF